MMETPSSEWRLCQQVIHRLLEKRGWRLIGISEDALISATLDDFHSEECALTEVFIEKCAARQYVVAFYRACQADRTPIQAEAFQYLGERLARIALYKTGDEDWAKDCAQRALKNIYEKLDTCDDPRQFFSWTRQIVLNEFYQDLRQMGRYPEEPLNAETDSEGDETHAEETDVKQSIAETPEDMLSDTEDDLAAKQLVQRIHQVLGDSQQWRVVAEFYLNGRSYSEIAELLQTTPNNVYVIMHRAIQKLRSDSQLAQDLQGFFGGTD